MTPRQLLNVSRAAGLKVIPIEVDEFERIVQTYEDLDKRVRKLEGSVQNLKRLSDRGSRIEFPDTTGQ
jgi:hypothetical protein